MTVNSREWFGTDGIRGVVGVYPITPTFFMDLGYAVGKVLQKQYGEGEAIRVLLGQDPRESSDSLQETFIKGLFFSGVPLIHTVGVIPAPGIAYLTRADDYHMGVMISASHNLFSDNGIKFFCGRGFKLTDEEELAIEKQLKEQGTAWRDLAIQSQVKSMPLEHGVERYGAFCMDSLNLPLSLEGMKLVVDCANGATYEVGPQVLKRLGAEVITISAEPNGCNINEACGATDLRALCEAVVREQAHLGIAFDGDGDRLMLVDHIGNVVDGDEILFILLQHYRSQGIWQGGLVGTQMTNLSLASICEAWNVPFMRTAVGDRYVLEALHLKGWQLGGESSGHIICYNKTTTGDGLLAALQVLESLQVSHQSLYSLRQGIKKCPQVLVNVPFSKDMLHILTHEEVQSAVVQGEAILGNKGRILLRLSGTEPLIRVMVEGEDSDLIQKIAQGIAKVIQGLEAQ